MVERTDRGALAGALGWVAAGSMVANVCAYLIHLTASRWWLSTAEYGEFAVGLSAMLVLGVAALALQAVVARAVVQHADPARIRRVSLMTVGVVIVLVGAAAPLMAWFASMGVDAALAALSAAPMLAVIGAAQGVLQGRGQFRLLGWVLAAVGVLRTVPVIAVLAAGAGPTGALAAGALGAAVGAVLVAWAVRSTGQVRPTVSPSVPGGLDLLDVVRASGVQLVLIVAASVDLLLSRTVLSADDAGIYALGAIATKVAFWLPQAVGVVFYPRLADPAISRRSLAHAVMVVAGIGVVLTAGAAVAGPLVPVVVRPEYQPLVGVLWLFAYTGSMLAVLQVALLSAIARQATAISLVTWVSVGAEVVVILTVVHGIVALAVTAAVTATVAAVTTTLVGLRPGQHSGAIGAAAMRD
ncbi:polysaccharide biosynthesis protein [Gordonia sp. SL306]|uniref:polysaccharide biosynthesis protein n=1 Tax=Gordonia sp. SL306 TaxID=2995145 RepID=UPI002271F8AD|nr:polysaccharide biosynthesis protein [Gordonia sp. SL306]WAC53704.1 polysaccharide biosynthesis protein [Gordonia sp. SL306]